MTVTVILSKSAPDAWWSAQVKGSGPERGKNLLTKERRSKSIDAAKAHAVAAVRASLPGQNPTIQFETEGQ